MIRDMQSKECLCRYVGRLAGQPHSSDELTRPLTQHDNTRARSRVAMLIAIAKLCERESTTLPSGEKVQYTFGGPGQQGAVTGRVFASHLLLSTSTYWQCLPAGSAHAQDACTQAVCIASLEALTGPAAHHGLRRLALQYALHYHSLIVLTIMGLGTMRFAVHDCEETRDLARKAVEMKW